MGIGSHKITLIIHIIVEIIFHITYKIHIIHYNIIL